MSPRSRVPSVLVLFCLILVPLWQQTAVTARADVPAPTETHTTRGVSNPPVAPRSHSLTALVPRRHALSAHEKRHSERQGVGPSVAERREHGGAFRPMDESCISGWNCDAINSADGSASEDAGTFTITSDGSMNGTGNLDTFYFVNSSLGSSSTGNMATRIASTPTSGRFGIELRGSTNANAGFYLVEVDGSGNLYVEYRRYPGMGETTLYEGSVTLPLYVKVRRENFTFTASTSVTGSSYTDILGSQATIGMGTTLAGFTVTNGDTGTFDNVTGSIGSDDVGSCASGWNCEDIGSPSSSGDEKSIGDSTWEMDGAGTGLTGYWTTDDQMRYAYKDLGADSQVTVEADVTAMVYAGSSAPYTQAGVMIRQSDDPLAPFYSASVTSAGTVRVPVPGSSGMGQCRDHGPRVCRSSHRIAHHTQR